MISIDYLYGILFLIEGVAIFIFGLLLKKKVNKNPMVYISEFMLNPGREKGFMVLAVGYTVLAIAYFISAAMAFSDVFSPVWEIGNLIVFGLLAVFYYLFYK